MENNKIILIVEDEVSLRDALRDRLVHEGFTALEARNGEEGLAVAIHEHPDLILLDIIMPVMDGMTMLQKLRQDPWGKDARVIILTNVNELEKVSQAVGEKAFDYIIKSDEKLKDVVAMVRQRLGV